MPTDVGAGAVPFGCWWSVTRDSWLGLLCRAAWPGLCRPAGGLVRAMLAGCGARGGGRCYWAGERCRGEVSRCAGAGRAWRAGRRREADGAELLGSGEGGMGLGGALLGVAQFGDGLGEGGEPDDHDRPPMG